MVTLSGFKTFSKLDDENDVLLQSFIDSAKAQVLRLIGLEKTDPLPDDPSVDNAVYTLSLCNYQQRDFPRPELEKSVYMHVTNLLAGHTKYGDRLVLTEAM